MSVATERCWLTEPQRKTLLANVIEVRGERFRLDRSIYCPRTSHYRHPQDPDRGTVWLPNGEKRKLVSVHERDGEVWHALRDVVPGVGDRLNCHLDVDRRTLTSRAHTAMHLWLNVLVEQRGPAVRRCEVKGGGNFRIELEARFVDVEPLFAAMRRQVRADLPLHHAPIVRDDARHRVLEVPWSDGVTVPGPAETLDVVFMGDAVRGIPCNGTFVARTLDVGDVHCVHAHANADGFVVVGQVT